MVKSCSKIVVASILIGASVQASPLSSLRSRIFGAPNNRKLAQYCADQSPNLSRINTMIVDQKLDPSGEPLYNAVKDGSPETVDLLLKHGAAPYPSYFSDHGPVRLAVELNKSNHLNVFQKNGTSFYKNSWSEALESKMNRATIFATVNAGYLSVLGVIAFMYAASHGTDMGAVGQRLLVSIPVFGFITYKAQQKLIVKNDSLLALAARGGHKETINQILNGLSKELSKDFSSQESSMMFNKFIGEALVVAKNGSTRDQLEKARMGSENPEGLE